MNMIEQQIQAIAVTAPSGAGKGTFKSILENEFGDKLGFSVSATTRELRPKQNGDMEKDGVDYYHLSVEEFKQRVARGDFLEHEEVYPGKFYGTLRSEVERLNSLGKIVLFDVDVKGAANLKKQLGSKLLTIFIMPPSLEVLEQRLRARGSDTEDAIKERIARYPEELAYQNVFDEKIINDKMEDNLLKVKALLKKYKDRLVIAA